MRGVCAGGGDSKVGWGVSVVRDGRYHGCALANLNCSFVCRIWCRVAIE